MKPIKELITKEHRVSQEIWRVKKYVGYQKGEFADAVKSKLEEGEQGYIMRV
ncbi:hypothetical protein MUB15_08430 [Priestia sp. OVS21]|nr:hypothetical protein [Priestia sp. OVS21]